MEKRIASRPATAYFSPVARMDQFLSDATQPTPTRTMMSHELFAAMPATLAAEILEFNHTNDKKLYRAAVDAIAQARKLRPVFLERQPPAERYATMTASLSRPA